MRSLVIIFIPVGRPAAEPPATSVRELLQHLAADLRCIRDAQLAHVAERTGATSVCPDQLWTWFLPNPMWTPKERRR